VNGICVLLFSKTEKIKTHTEAKFVLFPYQFLYAVLVSMLTH